MFEIDFISQIKNLKNQLVGKEASYKMIFLDLQKVNFIKSLWKGVKKKLPRFLKSPLFETRNPITFTNPSHKSASDKLVRQSTSCKMLFLILQKVFQT